MRSFWISLALCIITVISSVPKGSAFCQNRATLPRSFSKFPRFFFQLSEDNAASNDRTEKRDYGSFTNKIAPIVKILQLTSCSALLAILLISWEDLSMAHPIRQSMSSQTYGSTVRGMAFGLRERQLLQVDIEPEQLQSIPSYNEVMLKHRTERVPSWGEAITKLDVQRSVRTVQLALQYLDECKTLANDYEWERLATSIHNPLLNSQLDEACGILKRADGFLPTEARTEIGFDWGSCAWRHCGAFADARESLDAIDHLIGILEPFEAEFGLDIVERSLRDILAVTTKYQDPSIVLREYTPLKRMSDLENVADIDGNLDADYLAALSFLRSSDT